MNKATTAAALLLLAGAAAAQAELAAPIALVRVPGGCYEMGRTEVTQGQWRAVMGSNPSKFAMDDSQPVEMVSWNDAQEFLRRLNAGGTGVYRLPTEAEWEYACRSGGKDEVYAGTSAAGE